MMGVAHLRRGWCPGVLTPMETGDGWLVRVRPRVGAYSVAQLFAIAEAAALYGNSAIDLTSRANLQIRGLTPETIAAAQEILFDAGLIDDEPAAEHLRNIAVSPFSGIDPAAFDVRPLAQMLEAALVFEERLRALPGKFGVALDGGGTFSSGPSLSDITLWASDGAFFITLDGAPETRANVDEKSAVEAIVRLALVFVERSENHSSIRRMRDLVRFPVPAKKASGVASIFKLAGLDPIEKAAAQVSNERAPIGYLGPVEKPWGLSIGLPYGRISAVALIDLVATAQTLGISEFRPATSRTLIAPLQSQTAPRMVESARKSSLITDGDDPRMAMDACPGAPACSRGTTQTRLDADAIAAVLDSFSEQVPSVHVSGCIKGCAKASPAAFTFVGRDGLYDLVRDGMASGPPLQTGLTAPCMKEAIAAFAGDRRG